jgi:hypothetical protein
VKVSGQGPDAKSELSGSLDMMGFTAERSAQKIEAGGYASLSLERTRPGVYEGYGYLSRSPRSRCRVVLKVSGVFDDLNEPGLFTLFVVRPFVR